jgi:3',5'-nucleoside bisphosphate phosphatase
MVTVDLHIHSHYSNDGEFSPETLVALCLQAGLTHAAIADHNSVKAIGEAIAASEGTPLTIVPAVELDCVFDGVNLHLLGYGIEHIAPVFGTIEDDIHQQEQNNAAELKRLVRQLGIDFDDDIIAGLAYDGVVTGEMISEAALIYDRAAENPLLDPYRGDGGRSDNPFVNFYWDYCAQGKPAYVPMNFMHLSQAIEIIVKNHGVPILAHPGINIKEDAVLLGEILAEGILGIEVYSSYHNQQQVQFYRDAALAQHLLMTCGSDFHGKTKKSIKIGGINCEDDDQRMLEELLRAIRKMG